MSINRMPNELPETAVVERLRTLERNLREFKQGVQYPTVVTTLASTVQFSLQDDSINAGGDLPTFNVQARLTSPTGKRLFAIPEASIFWGSYPVAPEDPGSLLLGPDDRKFPEGNKFVDWASLPQWYKDIVPDNNYGRVFLDFNWWYDWLWSFAADGDEVATFRLRIDSALQNQNFPPGQFVADYGGNGFTFYQWWRYMSPGAETV